MIKTSTPLEIYPRDLLVIMPQSSNQSNVDVLVVSCAEVDLHCNAGLDCMIWKSMALNGAYTGSWEWRSSDGLRFTKLFSCVLSDWFKGFGAEVGHFTGSAMMLLAGINSNTSFERISWSALIDLSCLVFYHCTNTSQRTCHQSRLVKTIDWNVKG